MADETIPNRSVTPRGFGVYDELTDKYGSRVRVQESSLATDRCAWIFASHPVPRELPGKFRRRLEGLDERELGELVSFLTPAPHLTAAMARRVRDALDAFIAESEASEPVPDHVRDDFGRSLQVAGTPGMLHLAVREGAVTTLIRLSGTALEVFDRGYRAARARSIADAETEARDA